MLETVLAPGADSGERQIMESSEQAGYVLKGQLTMEVNGEQRILNPGDAFQIGGGTPCRYRNAGGEPVRVLWMFS
jgi:quercetin dioxygenase-like cupin family protein